VLAFLGVGTVPSLLMDVSVEVTLLIDDSASKIHDGVRVHVN